MQGKNKQNEKCTCINTKHIYRGNAGKEVDIYRYPWSTKTVNISKMEMNARRKKGRLEERNI